MMLPGDQNQYGPAVAVSSYGKGKVLAVPDHQMLDMSKYTAESSNFYRNAISWTSGTTDLSIKIVTLQSTVRDWLVNDGGYTNAVLTTEANLIQDIVGATLFIGGWMGTNEPDANIEALKNFAVNGGGIMVAEFGKGYIDWWTSYNRLTSPASKLLKDVGIGFGSQQTYYTGTMDAIRATVQVTAEDVITAFDKDDTTLSIIEREYATGYVRLSGRAVNRTEALLARGLTCGGYSDCYEEN